MERQLIHDTRTAKAHEDEMLAEEPGGDPEQVEAATRAAESEVAQGHQRPAHDYGDPTDSAPEPEPE